MCDEEVGVCNRLLRGVVRGRKVGFPGNMKVRRGHTTLNVSNKESKSQKGQNHERTRHKLPKAGTFLRSI